MRHHFIKHGALTLVALVSFLGVLALSVTAQPAGGGQGGGGMGGGMMRGAGGMLDEQQWQLYREAVQKDNDKLRALDEKLRTAQKELMQATLAEKYDEAVVQGKADAVAKIQVQITLLRAKGLSAVAPTLKAEQKENLVNQRFGAMLLTGGGFDMMGRGGAAINVSGQDQGNRGRGRGGEQPQGQGQGQGQRQGQGRTDRQGR